MKKFIIIIALLCIHAWLHTMQTQDQPSSGNFDESSFWQNEQESEDLLKEAREDPAFSQSKNCKKAIVFEDSQTGYIASEYCLLNSPLIPQNLKQAYKDLWMQAFEDIKECNETKTNFFDINTRTTHVVKLPLRRVYNSWWTKFGFYTSYQTPYTLSGLIHKPLMKKYNGEVLPSKEFSAEDKKKLNNECIVISRQINKIASLGWGLIGLTVGGYIMHKYKLFGTTL